MRILLCKGGGGEGCSRPRKPPLLLKQAHPCLQQKSSVTPSSCLPSGKPVDRLAGLESSMLTANRACHHHVCRRGRLHGSFCLQIGWLRTLQPLRYFKTIHADGKISCHRQVGEGSVDHFVCKCECCALPNPLFLRESTLAMKKKHHVFTVCSK